MRPKSAFSIRSLLINFLTVVCLFAIVVSLVAIRPAISKAQSGQPVAVDLMLIIDNSCSMFKANTPGCPNNTLGTDRDFLRVRGAELFAARIAFGQLSPKDQIGAISFGSDYEVTYPLTTITDFVRNDLALKAEGPKPRGGTGVIRVLNAAYFELERHGTPGNRPAIVFLTDGVPDPKEGQSFSDITSLINRHSDIPVYMLLLQNQQDRTGSEYPSYIDAWKKLQSRVNNIKVYEAKDASDLLEVYYQVVKDLDAQPYGPPPTHLEAGQSREFYVSRFARCVVVTVAHPNKNHRGQVEITDVSGQVLKVNDPGVAIFNQYNNGPDNPIEVYSACGPRLQGQTGGNWRITAVGVDFSFFVEVGGAYEFQWLSPASSPAPLPGVLLLDQPVRPVDTANLQFRLAMKDGTLIAEPQRLSGEVKTPDGQTLVLPDSLTPDSQGIYSLPFQANSYSTANGWYEIKLQSEDPQQAVGDPNAVIAVQTVRINIDPNAPPIVPITPTFTPTPTLTPSPTSMPVTITVTPTPPPPPVCPGDPRCPPPPPNPLIIGGITLLVALVGGYILLRVLKKPPEGFVAIVDSGQVGSPRSLKGMAQGKPWKWWEVTVGPKGNLRIKPNSTTDSETAANQEEQSQSEPVTLPGGLKVSGSASADKRGRKSSARSQPKKRRTGQKDILGKFVREGDKTQFIKLDPKASRTLGDSRDTIMIGNIELRISLNRDKLNS